MAKTYQEQRFLPVRRSARTILGSGALLAVESRTGRVLAASDTAADVFGPGPVLGQALAEVFPSDTSRALGALLHGRASSPRPALVNGALPDRRGRLNELHLLPSGPLALLEVLRPMGPAPSGAWSSEMARARERMVRASSIAEAAEPILGLLPRWTGFDRAAVLELGADGELGHLAGTEGVGPERLCSELHRYLSLGRSRILADRDLEPSPVACVEPGLELDLGLTDLQPLFASEREAELPRSRWLLPIRVGGRLWGVVAADSSVAPVLVRHSLRTMLAALVDGLGSRLWVHTRGVGPAPQAPEGDRPAAPARPASPRADVASHLYDLDVHLRRLSTSLAHTFVLRAESAEPLPDLSGAACRIEELSELLAAGRSPLTLVRTELHELVDDARVGLPAPMRVTSPDAAPRVGLHVHRPALVALLRAASRRLPRGPAGWGLSFQPRGEEKGPRLILRSLDTGASARLGPTLDPRVELLDAIARRWGGGVSCLPPRGEVHIDLGPSAVR